MLKPSQRLQNLGPYLLAQVFMERDRARARGVDVIDLGVGNPDRRPAPHVVQALKDALDDPVHQYHRYPAFGGMPELREAIARWYDRRFGVSLDPKTEVLPLIGSKEGIVKFCLAHLDPGDSVLLTTPCYPAFGGMPELRDAIARWYDRRFGVSLDPKTEVLPLIGSKEGIVKFFLAHLDPGDSVLLTTPCYPAYLGALALAQAKLVNVPLTADHAFHPQLSAIPDSVADAAKILTVNYPHNPTGGTETPALYEEVVAFARHHDLCVISDIAYCDLSLDPSYRAHSLLEFDREKKNVVEFHSFSKTFSMQGWRIGFCAGNRDLIANLARIKSNMDFSIFMAVQKAALAALDGPTTYTQEMAALYRRRRDVFLEGASAMGYRIEPPKGGMYVWLPIPPDAKDSITFTTDLLAKTGVLVAPGLGFGPSGEGYVRVALCEEEDRLREACARMAKAGVRAESLV